MIAVRVLYRGQELREDTGEVLGSLEVGEVCPSVLARNDVHLSVRRLCCRPLHRGFVLQRTAFGLADPHGFLDDIDLVFAEAGIPPH